MKFVEAQEPLWELESRLGAHWPHLRTAASLALNKRRELQEALREFDSEDSSVVVSGSLARDEFSQGSDIDWTLLIDGMASPHHYDVYQRVGARIREFAPKDVGLEGTFSAPVFSHGLIHEIGGEDDTNRNTTRRLLLLLESRAVGREDAYKRVVRNILNRYLLEDRGFWRHAQYRVPRFLQNDFARYWRTMAVDFAYKLRKRAGRGWAIRNLKLRMSRKLIYVSGLLACYRCNMDFSQGQWEEVSADPNARHKIVQHLEAVFQQTPLSILAGVLLRFDHLDRTARRLLDAYDGFLGILGSGELRDGLEALAESEADGDETFKRARHFSHDFRDGLLDLFFDDKSGLATLTRNYGVF